MDFVLLCITSVLLGILCGVTCAIAVTLWKNRRK